MEVHGVNLCSIELLLTVVSVLTSYLVYCFVTFWTRRNVYQLPFGLTFDFIRKFTFTTAPGFVCFGKITDHLRAKQQRFGGFLMEIPYIITTDVDILKDIMNTYCMSNFHSRGAFCNEKIDPLSCNIINLAGARWKRIRTKLSPTFTTAKLKSMFETVLVLSKDIVHFVKIKAESGDDFEIKTLLTHYSNDVFASCAFGLESNSINNPESEFNAIFKHAVKRDTIDKIRITFLNHFPKLAELLKLKFYNAASRNFFLKLFHDVVTYRKEKDLVRNDFLQMLMDEMDPEKAENPFTFTEAAPQAYAMFVAAFETTATTLTFCFYELCIKQDLQDKVRNEIRATLKKHNNQMTYDACTELTYLNQFVNETLRFYPPIQATQRLCHEDYQVPGTNSIIPKGTKIIIPIYNIHHNPEYFPNPEVFNPERFSEENKANIAPYTFMPFGEGPRICIGMRFSQMQIPMVLLRLLENHRFTLSPKTELPIVYDTSHAFFLNIEGGLYVRAEKIE